MDTDNIGWNLESSYSKLPQIFYTKVHENPVSSPSLIIFNDGLAESLGFNAEEFKKDEGINILAGNTFPKGSNPLAQAYAGHQFAYFTMLGDGRATLIGEQITPIGERFDIQLKGSGRTPYSRGGDGRAALGPMLREYIISEAMHSLGVDTTRALAVVETGEKISRQTPLPGAILTRVAKSHLRVGTFEYAAKWGSESDLKAIADYSIERHFPHIKSEENKYLSLLRQVIKAQALSISKWQLVGFIHGVMNTDNMTISGETIDYGPCAFMDVYNPETVFSSIDTHGRYAYGNQPNMALWNLSRFAETLLPLLHEDKEKSIGLAREGLKYFEVLYKKNWIEGMRHKLGIFNEEDEDLELIEILLDLMEKHKADYTNTFVALTSDDLKNGTLFDSTEFQGWINKWNQRLNRQDESREISKQLMRDSNPLVIPRNYQVEKALDLAVRMGDYNALESLLDVLSDPYNHSRVEEEYMKPPEPSNIAYKTYCGT